MKLLRKKKGFSLLELLLVMAIIAALIVAAFIIYPKISSSAKVTNDIKVLSLLDAGIKGMYRGQAAYSGLTAKALIDANIAPNDLVDDGEIYDNFGALVLIDTYNNDSEYSIGFENVSTDACAKFVSEAGSSFYKLVVDTTTVKDTDNNIELDMSTLTSACRYNTGSDVPVTVYFYNK